MSTDIAELIHALRNGTMTLNQVAQRFRERSWPRRITSQPANYLELAGAAQEDPDPYIPGSFDDVVAAHQIGKITDDEYTVLSEAVAESKRAEDCRNE